MPGPIPLKPRRLTDRQEAFCQYYLTEPSGTRAAIKAGYSNAGARVQAHKMLTKANILRRVAELRHDRQIVYQVQTDSLLDKLEAVYHEAMEKGRLMAAIHAVAHQARLTGLLPGSGRSADAYGFLVADIARATARQIESHSTARQIGLAPGRNSGEMSGDHDLVNLPGESRETP